MRPVVRGDSPVDRHGSKIVFIKYQDARGELIKRLGGYCSYCEIRLPSALNVEHVQPKKPAGTVIDDRARNWHNFLLSCTNCNSSKGKKDVDLKEYFWPDLDNTYQVLKYSEGGVISPSCDLNDCDRQKALNTIRLIRLDRKPGNDSEAKDRRWIERMDAWGMAVSAKEDLKKCNTPEMRRQIKDTALSKGNWSIWMTVFQDDTTMLQCFIDAFPGTAADCFDENKKPVSRRGGQV